MVFSSITFLCVFLPIVIASYGMTKDIKIKNALLIIASILFYAYGEPVYVLLMLLCSYINYFMALQIEKNKTKFKLVVTLIADLGILCIFKYLGMLISTINILPGVNIPEPEITLPVGISFFTFQALSYVVDVYMNRVNAEKNFFNILLYISFFPQLIAGPIVKYHDIDEEIKERSTDINDISEGLQRFIIGLSKKVLIANTLGQTADYVYGLQYDRLSAGLVWIGAISYMLQIYFDFSGYSDMAIGLGRMFGFHFKENFDYPYTAKSIQDFWRRWHISLTNWFREYVYIPLGGNRKGKTRTWINRLFVFFLTGLWHGANWTFILWGMLYFVIQLAERFFGYVDKMKYNWMKHFYTLFVVNLAWVLFRSDDLFQAGRFILNMFGLNRNGIYSGLAMILIKENWVFLLAGFVFATPIARKANEYLYHHRVSGKNAVISVMYPIVVFLLFLVSVGYLAAGSYNPFIYFNF